MKFWFFCFWKLKGASSSSALDPNMACQEVAITFSRIVNLRAIKCCIIGFLGEIGRWDGLLGSFMVSTYIAVFGFNLYSCLFGQEKRPCLMLSDMFNVVEEKGAGVKVKEAWSLGPTPIEFYLLLSFFLYLSKRDRESFRHLWREHFVLSVVIGIKNI